MCDINVFWGIIAVLYGLLGGAVESALLIAILETRRMRDDDKV